jgi:hypothetical protein
MHSEFLFAENAAVLLSWQDTYLQPDIEAWNAGDYSWFTRLYSDVSITVKSNLSPGSSCQLHPSYYPMKSNVLPGACLSTSMMRSVHSTFTKFTQITSINNWHREGLYSLGHLYGVLSL